MRGQIEVSQMFHLLAANGAFKWRGLGLALLGHRPVYDVRSTAASNQGDAP